MQYLSVCSGIEAATVAWHPLGWTPVGFSEIEPFPSAVLTHHYPRVPNFGDMTKFEDWDIGTDRLDLLVGGTPCQAFSVAGLRKGLEDHRGNLTLTFIDIADHFDPEWIVWENVPGVLSSKDNAFGCFLAGLSGADEPLVAERGWDNAGMVSGPKRTIAWRILDAQYFGVAQRRRRVFVCAVRGSGNWDSVAALFPVGESMFWDSAPSRKAGKVTPTLTKECTGVSRVGHNEEGFYVEHSWPARIAPTLNAHFGEKQGLEDQHALGGAGLFTYVIPGNWIGRAPENGGNAVQPMHDIAPNLTSTDRHGVAHPMIVHGTQDPCVSDIAFAQGRNNGGENVVATPMAVRRLTPVECERLQGFPDNFTNIPWRKSPESPDGPRYKALGNSMAVPCMAWIGKRIELVRKIRGMNG